MADTDTEAGNDESKPSGGSMVSFIIAVVLLTLISAAAGFGAGGFLIDTPAPPQVNAAKAKKADGATTSGHGKSAAGGDVTTDGHDEIDAARAIEIINLEPVVTNLANPLETWVRVEASVELVSSYNGDKDLLLKTIAEDLLMFTRTLSLASISGSSGIAHYKEDISERARIRSGGAVNQVLLRMLVIE